MEKRHAKIVAMDKTRLAACAAIARESAVPMFSGIAWIYCKQHGSSMIYRCRIEDYCHEHPRFYWKNRNSYYLRYYSIIKGEPVNFIMCGKVSKKRIIDMKMAIILGMIYDKIINCDNWRLWEVTPDDLMAF